MKLIYFDDFQLGVLKGERVVNITSVLSDIPHRDRQDLMTGLIAGFDAYRPRIESQLATEQGTPLASVTLRAPLPRPRQISCMAVNYMENGTLDARPPMNAFHKSPGAIIGPGETMLLPDVPASVFEGEAELGVVIGRRASNVPAAQALSYVFGYVNFIDGSARGLPPAHNVFFQAKSRDTFAPVGPYIVTADEIADPQKLQVQLWVNEMLKQDFNTDDMAHDIVRCIEWVSAIHALEPGDIVATGTNHRGLSALHDGDRVELEIEGLGRLRIHVRDDLKRTWSRDTRLECSMKYVAETGQKAPPTGVIARQLSGRYAQT
ncbi:2-keto-4-pentenoate hydratase/2-oxohepta-3-ene-1,7-dioic acid hydratase (catechol pathway) [Burkholderia sp. WP9]|jgi:2-keto-4-pentenoate hydratase/2-oxohepta-3-ene-1,7-dioic acid hydratase in catechol pathway|uniref:fumarylacetoacetate hydrolase family protein n=1 Tax=Burkholderia sp. WP9 TaxID=1500263 RepID=UPI00089D7413|nr:fumarylacetoacetate hydrolase family protein [Burkholderia sp. WP9]SEF13812.1 2-keto-4-pentenoate hydratase/2-oxohepta-3-ene-1,7-dioic acid hydratase (catechol pathway) [Burkholderia sp. WP9]